MSGSSARPEPLRLLLAGEDAAHRDVAELLIDRRLAERVDWLDEHDVVHVRAWLDVADRRWLPLKDAYDRARNARLPVWGRFNGLPAEPEAPMWRAVLWLAEGHTERPQVVVLARDLDSREERASGLRQAIGERAWSFRVVRLFAQPEIEAWIIAGFEPRGPEEQRRLDTLRRRLSFDPVEQSERLRSTTGGDRDAKRVAEILGIDRERRGLCLLVAFDRWAARAPRLAEFLEDVDAHIVTPVRGH